MDIFKGLWEVLLANETGTLVAFLFAVIIYLLWEKNEVRKLLAKQTVLINTLHDRYDTSIKEIISKYHEGQIDLVKALDEIKIVLSSMQRKI